jgi:adenylosuccinate lyase
MEVELIHFGLTSEDTNNLAYACMLRDAFREVMLPKLEELLGVLKSLIVRTREIPMLARTHGQSASPTTVGKEIGVFLARLAREFQGLRGYRPMGKLNGATGTFAGLALSFPSIDWLSFSERFVSGLGLEPNLITTQIEPHDRLAECCDRLRRIHNILIDLDQDLWRYLSDGYFRLRVIPGEVGSSTMPHKVNPIDFENSEGNLGLSNSLLLFFAEKLTKSRLQRDLSDSTVLRNLGVALGHALLGYESILKGLSKLEVDEDRLRKELDRHPEVLAEAYQTILRAEGVEAPYEALKKLTRGVEVSREAMMSLVREIAPDPALLRRLENLRQSDYIGYAPRIADLAVQLAEKVLR